MTDRAETIYTDQVQPRVTVAMVRAALARQRDSRRSVVTLACTEAPVQVELIEAVDHGALGKRTVFRCPRCGAHARVLGHHEGHGWGCRACVRWRSRSVAQRRAGQNLLTQER